MAVGLKPTDSYYFLPSGSVMQPHSFFYEGADAIDIDGLWDRMYVSPKPVIIPCVYCQAHNALTSPCCVQCGAPMGASTRK